MGVSRDMADKEKSGSKKLVIKKKRETVRERARIGVA